MFAEKIIFITKMGKKIFTPEIIGEIRGLLKLKWSHSVIRNHMKKQGISISMAHISNIKNGKENTSKSANLKKKTGPQSSFTKTRLEALRKMATNPNPPTQQFMANHFK